MSVFEAKGLIVPIITPIFEDEKINFKELERQIERQISSGVDGIFVFGTNGEAYALSSSRKEEIMKCTVSAVSKRVPVYAGTGCITTSETIELSRKALKDGVDVLSIITPSFAVASQEELYTHYEKVASKVDLPIVLYNIPARTGNSLTASTVSKLSRLENIIGVKDSSGNFDNTLQFIEQTKSRTDFSVLAGNDSLILWTLIAGGKGAVSGCANVFPNNMVAIYRNFVEGNLERARECQDSIRSFRNCFKYGNPNSIVKKAVELLGFEVGNCIAPFNRVSDEAVCEIKKVLIENRNKGIS